jgi:hypothetical protein
MAAVIVLIKAKPFYLRLIYVLMRAICETLSVNNHLAIFASIICLFSFDPEQGIQVHDFF